MVREGFVQDFPDVAAFFKKYELNDQQLGSLMDDIATGEGEPIDAARKWMASHGSLVQSWLQ